MPRETFMLNSVTRGPSKTSKTKSCNGETGFFFFFFSDVLYSRCQNDT